MQGYQQGLVFLALFIIVAYADIKINSFGPHSANEATGVLSSVYATHVELVNLYFLVYLITLHIYL